MSVNRVASGKPSTMADIHGLSWAYWIAEIVIAVVATVTNVLVLVAFAANKKLRTIQNWYIVSLCFSDLLMGVFGIPFILIALAGRPRNFGMCITAVTIVICVEICSCFALFALSYDRFFAVCRPLKYTAQMSRRRVTVHITLAWVTPLLYSLLVPVVWNNGPLDRCTLIEVVDLQCMVVAFFLFFLPLYGVMCVMYYKIFQVIRKQLMRLSQLQEARLRLNLNRTISVDSNHGHHKTPLLGANTPRMLKPYDLLHRDLPCNVQIVGPRIDQVEQRRYTGVEAHRERKSRRGMTGNTQKVEREKKRCFTRSRSCPSLKSSQLRKNERSWPRINTKFSGPVVDDAVRSMEEECEETIRHEGELLGLPSCRFAVTATRDPRQTRDVQRRTYSENNVNPRPMVSPKTLHRLHRSRYTQERRSAVLFVFLLLVYFVSWSPIYIIDILLAYDIPIRPPVVNFAVFLSHCSSAFNPFLYAYKQDFRKVLSNWKNWCLNRNSGGTPSNQVYPHGVVS